MATPPHPDPYSFEELAQLREAGAPPKVIRALRDNPETPHAYQPQVLPSDTWALVEGSPLYPSQLTAISPSPTVLFGRGDYTALTPGVAIIGSRKLTKLGTNIIDAAIATLQGLELTIYSGLADGVDSYAHNAALDAGLTTVAVLGQGMRTLSASTPRGQLARRILKNGGAVLSELPSTQKTAAPQLIARNRIITGLAKITLPAESALRSGTMHGVGFTLTQGRTLLVAEPSPSWRTTPGGQGLYALTSSNLRDRDGLVLSPAAEKIAATREVIADAVAHSREELHDILHIYHKFLL